MAGITVIFNQKKTRSIFYNKNTTGLFKAITVSQTLSGVYRVKPSLSNNFHYHL